MSDFVTAFAPASIGNVGVGFDMLGLALSGAGDRVMARCIDNARVTVAEVRGLDGELHPYLSTNADENTASIAAQALWDAHGGEGSVELKVHKGVPLQSGMGSSAASAVAAAGGFVPHGSHPVAWSPGSGPVADLLRPSSAAVFADHPW